MRDDHFTMYKHANGKWYYEAYRSGIRHKKSTGETKKADALKVIMDRIAAGDILGENEKIRPKLFKDFAKDFWNYDTCPIVRDKIERGGHYSVLAASNYAGINDKDLIPTFGNRPLTEITQSEISVWHRRLPGRFNINPKTANTHLLVLRTMLNEAVKQNLIKQNPCIGIKPLIVNQNTRGCYTQEQIRLLFSQPFCDIFVEVACKLACTTGMRLGEIQALQREQVYDDYILVKYSYSEREGLKSPKSGKQRIVPILPEIRDAILSLPSAGQYIFSYKVSCPISYNTIEKKLKLQCDKVGVDWKKENLLFHSFRHYFNTRLVASGVDASQIRSVVGHESEAMTEHYLHLSSKDMDSIRKVQEQVLNAEKKES